MESFTLAMQSRRAAFAPTSVNESARTAELTWSTGATVKRFDWESGRTVNETLDLSPGAVDLKRLNSGAPLLDSHRADDLGRVIGVVESAWIANGEGRATVRFAEGAEVESIFRKVANRILRNISVGYLVREFRDMTKAGETVKSLLATSWEPVEISLVAVGADPGAIIRSAAHSSRCRIMSADRGMISIAHARHILELRLQLEMLR